MLNMRDWLFPSFVVLQAEKDAKKKARAKELKKLRKEKEKKAQVHSAQFFVLISCEKMVMESLLAFSSCLVLCSPELNLGLPGIYLD
jgi:hypothetical protein